MRLGLTRTVSLFALLIASPAWAEPANTPGEARRSGDIVCGPRSLQYILSTLKPSAAPDLLEIVTRVQPEFEKGSSLPRLKDYLEDQGLFTAAIKPASNSTIVWPHPVLLHLRGENDNLGHYVVLLPTSDRSIATMWSGLAGITRMPTWRLSERIDGGALLVSPQPIKEATFFFPLNTDALIRRLGWTFILIATPLIGFAWASWTSATHAGGRLMRSSSEKYLIPPA